MQNASDIDEVPPSSQFQHWLNLVFQNHPKNVELTVRVVDEPESQSLNFQFRQMNKPTNVLAFSAEELPHLEISHIGDLVICAPVVIHEAQHQQKPVNDHWAHLVIHGCLHLLGFDHQTDDEAGAMEAREIEILNKLGITNPYLLKEEKVLNN